jgi:shikimate dehydrogenase
MIKYGLIGFPLGHSFSKGYFTDKFRKEGITDCEYNNYPIERIEDLPELVRSEPDLAGLNVTIPYKQQVIPLLDSLDGQAGEIGAVNTIKIYRSDGRIRIKGYNTDILGFEYPLTGVLKPIHTSALILGTGGASMAVAYILRKHNITYKYVSRKPKDASVLNYNQLTPQIISRNLLIINCSPVGMHPDLDKCPDIPYEALTENHILYDLIYNPVRTLFLEKGELKKATLINGLPMLHIQAEQSWSIWNLNDYSTL